MTLLLLIGLAWGHGAGFGLSRVRPIDEARWWALVRDLGPVYTDDAGASWAWSCPDALGFSRIYDLLPYADGLLLAGIEGVSLHADCGSTPIPGLPAGALADHLAPTPGGFVVAALGVEAAGLYACTLDGCAPSDLVGPEHYVKSVLVADEGLFATVVTDAALAAGLYTSAEGERWEARYTWPAGDVDPRVLLADGPRLFVWAQPRAEGASGSLLRSEDGGRSFVSVLSGGALGDAIPGMARVGGGARLLIGLAGGQTLESEDQGLTWRDASDWMPEVACSAEVGEATLVCGDHILDGVDLFITRDGDTFAPASCLEEAGQGPCVGEQCAAEASGFERAADLGGGRCEELRARPAPASEEPPAEKGGCAGFLPLLLLPLARRRRAPTLASAPADS